MIQQSLLWIALVIAGIQWPGLNQLATLAMWAVVVFALVSAAGYFRKFWGAVDSHVKSRRRREILALQRQQRKLRRSGVVAAAKVASKG